MNQTVIILNSYTVNSTLMRGNFPIYVKGASQCCVDTNGILTIQPVQINKN